VVDDLACVDRFFEFGEFRDVGAQVLFEIQHAFLCHHHEGGGGELFGHGCDHESGVGADGDSVVKIGYAVPFGENRFTAADYADGTPGGVRSIESEENAVHVGFGDMAVIRAKGVAVRGPGNHRIHREEQACDGQEKDPVHVFKM